MTLVEEIYNVTNSFPRCEQFGLASQIRRASVLDIALGSQAEVEVQLEIARRVGFLNVHDHERIQAIVEEVGRMLNGLIASIRPARGP